MDDAKTLYIELLKKCLTGSLYPDFDGALWRPKGSLRRKILKSIVPEEVRLVQKSSAQTREEGSDWPAFADTMIGWKRLNNVQFCVEDVLKNNVPGDLIETGVWRGGTTIFMRGILKAYGATDRRVWVADSFQGLPPPDPEKFPEDANDRHHRFEELAISLEQVQANFKRYDLLDDRVRFLKGWFRDTLPTAPIEKLAVIRLDGDMYESTMDGLNNLYSKLSVGGYLIIDDYALEGCRKAIHDYRETYGIKDEIIEVDRTGAYWQRTEH